MPASARVPSPDLNRIRPFVPQDGPHLAGAFDTEGQSPGASDDRHGNFHPAAGAYNHWEWSLMIAAGAVPELAGPCLRSGSTGGTLMSQWPPHAVACVIERHYLMVKSDKPLAKWPQSTRRPPSEDQRRPGDAEETVGRWSLVYLASRRALPGITYYRTTFSQAVAAYKRRIDPTFIKALVDYEGPRPLCQDA